MKLQRTAYMQYLMTTTYPLVAIIALGQGTIVGAWEMAIAKKLYLDCYNDQNPQAFGLLEATGDQSYTKDTFLKAAYLVTGSESIKAESI